MITMAQSVANWRNTHTHVDRTHSLTHVHRDQHSHNHVVRSASSAISITSSGIDCYFILKVQHSSLIYSYAPTWTALILRTFLLNTVLMSQTWQTRFQSQTPFVTTGHKSRFTDQCQHYLSVTVGCTGTGRAVTHCWWPNLSLECQVIWTKSASSLHIFSLEWLK